ncbi:MAG: PrsW family intramembrane metalloprotease [Spirochaetaceae bacterium]|jgi:RsiW-degrading membrane proteinase PrsW (M82 family)|nr:PrsW family intramembrane metalloprotease [Spirochaetaceae bacterium]
MTGLWILPVLIFVSALPVIAAWVWFTVDRIPVPLPFFLVSLLAGIAALPLAGLLQSLFSPPVAAGMGGLLLRLFLQIALTEEAGRLVIFVALYIVARRFSCPVDETRAAAAGLVAGLGFAIIETASYGSSRLGIALLRAFTAAPIHGAAGSRVAAAVFLMPARPFASVSRFLGAVFIHGIYNLMVIRPGIPVFLPVVLVAAALLPVLRTIRAGRNRAFPKGGGAPPD